DSVEGAVHGPGREGDAARGDAAVAVDGEVLDTEVGAGAGVDPRGVAAGLPDDGAVPVRAAQRHVGRAVDAADANVGPDRQDDHAAACGGRVRDERVEGCGDVGGAVADDAVRGGVDEHATDGGGNLGVHHVADRGGQGGAGVGGAVAHEGGDAFVLG